MKIITLDQVYEKYIKERKPFTPQDKYFFGEYCDILKEQGYYIY